jgi:hypothetical protein
VFLPHSPVACSRMIYLRILMRLSKLVCPLPFCCKLCSLRD